MKIAIIGYSGSGKSTLAQRVGKALGLDVMHLDCVHWLPGWKARPKAESQEILRAYLDTHDSWVIDGNYGGMLYERRMREADRIIFMAFSRTACLLRALRRHRAYKGRTRASITAGCEEKMDAEFIRWILWGGRTGRALARYRRVQAEFADKLVVIRSQRELDAFMKAEGL